MALYRMSGSVRNQFAMAVSTVKQGLAVLQELNNRAPTATPRDDMRRTLITFLDVHFRYTPFIFTLDSRF